MTLNGKRGLSKLRIVDGDSQDLESPVFCDPPETISTWKLSERAPAAMLQPVVNVPGVLRMIVQGDMLPES